MVLGNSVNEAYQRRNDSFAKCKKSHLPLFLSSSFSLCSKYKNNYCLALKIIQNNSRLSWENSFFIYVCENNPYKIIS